MAARTKAMLDGNEAIARVAYPLNEVIAIYPITPASPMGKWADAWASQGNPNLWGSVPAVVEMQSEGGAAGAVHGALQTGSLTTTFTASQGLLLMLPNLYKIAGELTSAVIHVAASIFGDHSDVMAVRGTGFALLCSASVQEAHDFSLIAQATTLKARVPFLHFCDGFRTSHEIQKIECLDESDLRALIDDDAILAHREQGLSPDHPVLRGTAQNPDVFFQARESVNPFYQNCPAIAQEMMDRLGERTGRHYQLYEYHGAPDAEWVMVLIGSGCETVHETVDYLVAQGEKVGVLKVRLYRPWDAQRFLVALPETTGAIAVLDRTKEPGASGEPLYLDVVAALQEHWSGSMPKVVGGRYGLSSKEFTPAMVKSVFDNLAQDQPKNHFTVGIHDDLTHTSLHFNPSFSIEPESVARAVFYGLGSDGTVGANKNSIKIIGSETDHYAQGYFVYDSKKSGAVTVSHLRFGPQPIRSTYLIDQANFVGCHQWSFLEKLDVLKVATDGAILLLNSPYPPDQVWNHLPLEIQEDIVRKGLQVYAIDANQVAKDSGMGGRINTVMQTYFFALSGVLPREEGITQIKRAIAKTYGKKRPEIVPMNLSAVDNTLDNLHRIEVETANSPLRRRLPVPETAPEFVREVLGSAIALNLYFVPTDMEQSGSDTEQIYLDILRDVKAEVTIPVAMKLSPFFTNFAYMARCFTQTGANGLVLFNRFLQPEINPEALAVEPQVHFSHSADSLLAIRWIAILYGRVATDFAATGGIHTGRDVIKALMAGAKVTQVCSALLRHGIDYLQEMEQQLQHWMRENEYVSVKEMQGSMSQLYCADESAYERAQYMRLLQETHPLCHHAPTAATPLEH